MLEKIESAYLAVMRVVVLIAATVALVVCLAGATTAAPSLLRQFGLIRPDETVAPVDLAKFMDQKRAVTTSSDDEAAPQVTIIPAKIATASKIIDEYLRIRANDPVDLVGLETFLAESRNKIDYEYQSEYEDSVLSLANQLKRSTGKPLSLRRVSELLDWHNSEFLSNIELKKSDSATEAARSSAAVITFTVGLAAFILILFFFLFVKIERNLRLVRTREVNS